MYNLSCFKSARWEIVLLYKTAVVKQLSLGTKSQCYTMVLLSPTLSTYALMKGRFRMEPRTGILLMKPITTGKKPLNKRKKP